MYSNLLSTVSLASLRSCLTSTGPSNLYTTAPSSRKANSYSEIVIVDPKSISPYLFNILVLYNLTVQLGLAGNALLQI